MPYTNEHSCHLNNYPAVSRKNCDQKSGGKCIDVIYGRKPNGSTGVRSLRYKKAVWSASEARAHCKSRGGSFEAAKSGSGANDNPLVIDAINRNAY